MMNPEYSKKLKREGYNYDEEKGEANVVVVQKEQALSSLKKYKDSPSINSAIAALSAFIEFVTLLEDTEDSSMGAGRISKMMELKNFKEDFVKYIADFKKENLVEFLQKEKKFIDDFRLKKIVEDLISQSQPLLERVEWYKFA